VKTSTSGASPQEAPAAAVRGTPVDSHKDVRLHELFRVWLREGHVHPLIHLIRQFRAQNTQ
jgi:hypothetical protein